MMSFGPLGFLQPWILFALFSLPVIWYILKIIPPKPSKVLFPPVRLLIGLQNKDNETQTIPWWLLLLRMLIIALLILAFSQPVWKPKITSENTTNDRIVLVDNGWTSGTYWKKYQAILENIIADAELNGQRILLVGTAEKTESRDYEFLSPKLAKKEALNLQPHPFKPNRLELLKKLQSELDQNGKYQLTWITDGIDYGRSAQVTDLLQKIVKTSDPIEIYTNNKESSLGLYVFLKEDGNLVARILSAGDQKRKGTILAWSAKKELLGETEYSINENEKTKDFEVILPNSIRNQIAYISISGEESAGAVYLLDTSSLRYRVGIISGETNDISQPLLSPTYYINKALKPYVDITSPEKKTLTQSLAEIFETNPSILIMADIGSLSLRDTSRIQSWVEKGGMLVRFSGRRMQTKSDPLLPVNLRHGRRALGGALSWSTPQTMDKFEKSSPFYGLTVTNEIKISRQVLADPQSLANAGQVWSRLSDGTPLVTAKQIGKGWVTLFHITANSEWSNLPLSGLFVEMLRRLTNLANTNIMTSTDTTTSNGVQNTNIYQPLSVPSQILNGFGELVEPPSYLKPIDISQRNKIRVSRDILPGFYGSSSYSTAVNILHAKSQLKKNVNLPKNAKIIGLEIDKSFPLMAYLICIAIAGLLIDTVIKIAFRPKVMNYSLATAKIIAFFCLIMTSLLLSDQVRANEKSGTKKLDNLETALKASLDTRLGYVITGNQEVDRISKFGLSGLSKVIAARTAVEPVEPVAVNILKDELVFFPMIYWPVLKDTKALPDKVLSKIDAYLKLGGMIVFDTKDAPQAATQIGSVGPGMRALRRLIGRLNIPQVEPAFEGHVVSKSFYLLKKFPGRWDGGKLWVEARKSQNARSRNQVSRSDGVSSILITSNDFSGAWALDENNRPLLPVIPGGEFQREMAFRVGVNIVIYALTGNYKADQVHVPALLERLGQ